MFTIANLSFAAPWTLMAVMALPLLWHLLKVTPPKPRVINFPAVRLLQELTTEQILATKTPWWIIILRSLILLFLIAAMAQPIWNADLQQGSEDRPLMIVVDNDWSVIDRWSTRKDEILNILEVYERFDQPVLLATTTDTAPVRFDTAKALRKTAFNLSANPWEGNHAQLLDRLKGALANIDRAPRILYISNGLQPDEENRFIDGLHRLGDLEVIGGDQMRIPAIIHDAQRTDKGFQIKVLYPANSQEREISINLLDEQGNTLYRHNTLLEQGDEESLVNMDFPAELRSKASRLHISGYLNPASQYLLDEKWRDRPVGLIDSGNQSKTLLSPAYYIRKSLAPYSPLHDGDLNQLLSRKTAVLIDPRFQKLNDNQLQQLEQWIESGGIFIRFAASAAENQVSDILTPVDLVSGQRTLGGTLSWKRPANLAPFPENTPFEGLNISEEIKIKKQVLAKPEPNLASKTWASLQDGTPLITAAPIKEGWSILFHITPVPDWSNLPLSGTFELMMIRLLNLSAGSDFSNSEKALPPYRIFDGNGSLISPIETTRALSGKELRTARPDQTIPPGLYGLETSLSAFNLGPSITGFSLLGDLPLGVTVKSFNQNNETDLAPWALLIALCLALLDWMLVLTWLRPKAIAASLLVLTFFGVSSPAMAEPDWNKMLAAANHMRLAYMVTGNAELDDISRRGLKGLGVILKRRTAVELSPPMEFDPEKDDPSLFPMIYWPISSNQDEISDDAAQKLNKFMRTGGFILFDTMGEEKPAALSRLTDKLNIASLRPIPQTHVLTRSFYLMQSFPGRFDHENIWVEAAEDAARDRVSSVLIGPNSWAQAWAKDDALRPMFAVVPGGEVQREYAYRFGVNLVMYILSGNYKGDQVHLPAIMQRLGL